MTRWRSARQWSALVLVTALLAGACQAAEDPEPPGEDEEFPRHQTLYTSGNAWEPPSGWNPLLDTGQATGVRGLLYEPLFLYDPVATQLQPWLAERGEWTSDTEFVVTLREGIQWSDDQPLTAADVAFTFHLGEDPELAHHRFSWYAGAATAEGDRTVRFTFQASPPPAVWDELLYRTFIVPEHTWGEVPEAELAAANGEELRVGSGPYRYHSHDDTQVAWERHDGWWGTAQLGLEMAPRFIIDLVNARGAEAQARLQRGEVDIVNQFLPEIAASPEFGETITTYFPEPPYMLPANTLYLLPNNTRPPLDDPEFRRALAFSIDIATILDEVYDDTLAVADPTGLPAGSVDQALVAEHGFQHDPAQARDILAGAGYTDQNGDGLVQLPDGRPVSLRLAVPQGFTDWEQAAELIAADAREAGIDVVQDPDFAYFENVGLGQFDLAFRAMPEPPAAIWVVYQFLFALPIQENQGASNVHRHEHPRAWDLTQELLALPRTDPRYAVVLAELQEISLVELPAIPLWHLSLWSQVNNSVWTNWPSSAPDTPDHYPSTVEGIWEQGAIYLLTELQPADRS